MSENTENVQPEAAETESVEADHMDADQKAAAAFAAMSPREHRRVARFLLIGRPGLTHEQKIALMEEAVTHLQAAIATMKTGEV